MKDTAPKWQGVIAVAALFGVIAAGIAWVVYNYEFPGAALIGMLVALIVAILLWLGWRDADPAPMGARDISGEARARLASESGEANAEASSAGAGAAHAGASGAIAASAAGAAAVSSASTSAGGGAAKADADAKAAAAKAKADADAKAAAAKAKADADAKAASKADAKASAKAASGSKKKAGAAKTTSTRAGANGAAASGAAATAAAGTQPAGLSGPRGGRADDLKKIRGVGPKLEGMMNGMGYYHYDQVANWSDEEVAWVDGNIEGFPGRVTRDNWVPQAKMLASGEKIDPAVLDRIKSGEDVDLTDYDGDGIIEGKNEGTRPAALDGPRGGKADNLKEIKGVGPKMEKLCNSLGFYHFDQIAAWTPDEVAWVDANLEGFKGRVTRDTWVAQAKILAAGGETEFSKKVDKGGVY